MTPIALAVLSIVVLLVLIFLRMPISFSLLAVGLGGMFLFAGPNAAMQLIASDVYRQTASYSMVVIPLFIFMGQVIFNSGMSTNSLTLPINGWVTCRAGLRQQRLPPAQRSLRSLVLTPQRLPPWARSPSRK
nr:TRAP transporter large permease subunit [Salinibacterium sp. PAMC 21357]